VLRKAKVSVRFSVVGGATVTFGDTIEVSLDCCVCHRCHRTVIFEVGKVEGQCTPTGHAFPGKVMGKEAGQIGSTASATYMLDYWYEPFQDAKYADRRKPEGRPNWARVPFAVICPSCGQSNKASTQNNIVRPWVCHCKCGQELYTELEEMPVLS